MVGIQEEVNLMLWNASRSFLLTFLIQPNSGVNLCCLDSSKFLPHLCRHELGVDVGSIPGFGQFTLGTLSTSMTRKYRLIGFGV